VLRIRQDQRVALFDAMRDDPREKLLAYLRERLADRVAAVGTEAFDRQVDEALERARAHGIVIEWDLCRFAMLDLIHGPRFEAHHAWARRILAKEAWSPTERVLRLELHHRNYYSSP
jgi:hypothetical protein